jgi:hypothetical protein
MGTVYDCAGARKAELDYHPLADIFPLMADDEFAELVADIKANGLHEPIVLLDDLILDGRNRYRACLAADVVPALTPFRGDDPVAFIISVNIRRRHLNQSQRAMVAAKLATLRGGQRADLVEGLPIGRASEMLSVGERTVARAREVQDGGVPELVGAVERGDVSVSAAADIATLPVSEQAEVVARGEREILLKAKEIRAGRVKRSYAARMARFAEISAANAALPQMRYPVIYCDPPVEVRAVQRGDRRRALGSLSGDGDRPAQGDVGPRYGRLRVVHVGDELASGRCGGPSSGVGIRPEDDRRVGEAVDRPGIPAAQSPRAAAHRHQGRHSITPTAAAPGFGDRGAAGRAQRQAGTGVRND